VRNIAILCVRQIKLIVQAKKIYSGKPLERVLQPFGSVKDRLNTIVVHSNLDISFLNATIVALNLRPVSYILTHFIVHNEQKDTLSGRMRRGEHATIFLLLLKKESSQWQEKC